MFLSLYGCEQSSQTPEAPVVADSYHQTGTVLETIDVDSYTYVRLDRAGGEVWLASTPVSLSEGDEVGFANAMMMSDFHSKNLDRTFAEILFVNNLELIKPAGTQGHVQKPASSHTANPNENVQAEPAAFTIKTEALDGGKTIAEIFAEREQIEGQEVSLRAKVIKFSSNILGKNWVTLQDGTGTEPDNALVVTTSETVAVGDEIIVKGLAKNDVDIGAGYIYKVILEEASITQ